MKRTSTKKAKECRWKKTKWVPLSFFSIFIFFTAVSLVASPIVMPGPLSRRDTPKETHKDEERSPGVPRNSSKAITYYAWRFLHFSMPWGLSKSFNFKPVYTKKKRKLVFSQGQKKVFMEFWFDLSKFIRPIYRANRKLQFDEFLEISRQTTLDS